MSPTFPPRPSKRVIIALAVVALVTFAYSFVIAGQILLWFVLVGGAVGLYLTYLLIIAVFRLVEAVERLAVAREAEVDGADRTVEADAGSFAAGRPDGSDEAVERTGRDTSEDGG